MAARRQNGCAVHGLSRRSPLLINHHLIVSYGISCLVFLHAATGKLFALSICLPATDDCVVSYVPSCRLKGEHGIKRLIALRHLIDRAQGAASAYVQRGQGASNQPQVSFNKTQVAHGVRRST